MFAVTVLIVVVVLYQLFVDAGTRGWLGKDVKSAVDSWRDWWKI